MNQSTHLSLFTVVLSRLPVALFVIAGLITLVSLMTLTGCGTTHKYYNESAESPATTGSLNTQLAEMRKKFEAGAEPSNLEIMKQAHESLKRSGIYYRAVKTGDKAPDFTLPSQNGNAVTLSKLLEQGPVVLVFYRGQWCPYCNAQLTALNAALPNIKAAGGTLVAVSPQLPTPLQPPSAESNADAPPKLNFSILSDRGNQVAEKYGLAYELPEKLQALYKEFGINLQDINGDGSWTLPLAASYVIAPSGTVQYGFVETDYTKRAEPDFLIQQLKTVQTP